MSQLQGTLAEMDTEWVELILTARKLGISKEEIRNFLKHSASHLDNHAALLSRTKPLSVQWIGE